MAEKKESSENGGGFLKRFFRMSQGIDPLDSGAAGAMAFLAYRALGSNGNLFSAKAAETIAPALADEANFERLLDYVGTHGGSRGEYLSNHLFVLNQALINIHEVYGEQFRNKFFSGLEEKQILDRLDKLFNEAVGRNDRDAWNALDSVKDMIIKQALRIARRVDSHIKGDTDREKAATIVAHQMIKNKELPGSIATHTEARFGKAADHLNEYLQKRIQKRNEEKAQQEEIEARKETISFFARLDAVSFVTWIKIVVGMAFATFMIVSTIIAMEPPAPKPKRPNPLAPIEKKISENIRGAYDFITEEK